MVKTLDEYLDLIEAERECRPAEAMLADEIKRLRGMLAINQIGRGAPGSYERHNAVVNSIADDRPLQLAIADRVADLLQERGLLG